jgi:ATP-dependent 26S proteasome regulatory subunit
LETQIAEDNEQIQTCNAFLELDILDVERKLNVKYGRGLLLYGPPGTGKF